MTFFGKHKRKKAASNKLVKGTASTPSLPLQASPVPAVPRITSQSSYNLAPPPPWSPPFPPRPQTSSAPGRWQATNLPYRYPPAVNPASSAYLPLPPQSPPIQSNPWPQRPSKWKSSTNLPQAITNPVQTVNDGIGEWQQMTTGYLNRGAALCDLIGNKFDAVITLIDEERFSGDERELGRYSSPNTRQVPLLTTLQSSINLLIPSFEAEADWCRGRSPVVPTMPSHLPSRAQTISPRPISTQTPDCLPTYHR